MSPAMSQRHRIAGGVALDRSHPLDFTFNGKAYTGFAGDTLASALLANGVHLVARSFKYHRPRGIMSAGVEEPNAIVQVGSGARTIPNLKATEVQLYEGLRANSVNVFPTVDFDLAAVIGGFSALMPAGFYYKSFFGTRFLWRHVYEPLIRQAGGWGMAPEEADPDFYDRTWHHCDVLVIGGGAAGLAAALAAAGRGARVTVVDEGETFGGTLLNRDIAVDNCPAAQWVRDACGDLASRDEVCLLPRTTVFGYYDGNCLAALERRTAPGAASSTGHCRQRLWHFRARRVVLATGAHERPLVFANNDRPGIMLAGAVQAYIFRWAVLPGKRAVLFTNNDRAYECVLQLVAAGAEVAAVVDSRKNPEGPLVAAVRAAGIPVRPGQVVVDTRGRKRISGVAIASLEAGHKTPDWLGCDLLAVSGGLSPVVHLHSQAQGKLHFDEALACFRPRISPQPCASAGACNGTFGLGEILAEGYAAGLEALAEVRAADQGNNASESSETPAAPERAVFGTSEAPAGPPSPLKWEAAGDTMPDRSARQFIDLQNDSTVADIMLSVREGFESVEHMKRYTLTGFGTDQGKTSNINGLTVLAGILDEPIQQVGTTTFRPPYTPVTFAAMGGRDRGELFEPERHTSIHERHVRAGAVFEDVGQWKRPWYYPHPGEDMHAAVARECAATREGVGILDASTLGKIDIQGPDAAGFLDRMYTNDWLKLPVGKVRYGIMCREDGMVFDDGTTSRLDENRYLMTTTTGNAAHVLDHLEEYLQTEWPSLRVRLTSVTEQWATVSIAGPLCGRVLSALCPGIDLSAEAFPFLAWRDAVVADLPARIFRISFTGELQYEINVPWHAGGDLWDRVMQAGEKFGITPYGTETMHVLRAEKGFIIIGQETDGTQTPSDLGLDWALSGSKDFIGRRSLRRPDCKRSDRRQLVGLMPSDSKAHIHEGAQLVAPGLSEAPPPVPMQGFVTSSYYSPALASRFCLALVDGGRVRHGEMLEVAREAAPVAVKICSPVFYDPEGARRDGA